MRVLTGSDDNTARVWRADGNGEPFILRGHDNAVNSVAWSPDGTWVLTGSQDKTARVWPLVQDLPLLAAIARGRVAFRGGLTAKQKKDFFIADSPNGAASKPSSSLTHLERTP